MVRNEMEIDSGALVRTWQDRDESRKRGTDSRMCMTRHQYVNVHLPCDGTQRIEIAGRNTLVAVHDTDADRCMHHRRGGRKAGVLQTRTFGEHAGRACCVRSKRTERGNGCTSS